mgnify:CR=1 FL=1
MADVFKEYRIEQKKTPQDRLKQVGVVVGAIIVCLVLLMINFSIGFMLDIAVVCGAGYLLSKLNKEYEYTLTNSEIDIDVIYNKNSRKRIITIDIKKANVMASIKDERHLDEINKTGLKVINTSDNANDESTYAIITESEKVGLCKVLISPNDTLLDELYKQAPNKVFKKNPYKLNKAK